MNSMLSEDSINICYAIYDKSGNFSKIAGTAIVSVFENTTSHISLHLLHDNTLTEENRTKFIKLTRSYGQEISFYNIEKMLPDIFDAIPGDNRFSKAAMYRMLIGNILPHDIKRVIYLDIDTIVTLDIKELWCENIGENGLAAISEKELTHDHMIEKHICQSGFVSKDRYFNSGVLLIDMEKFRLRPNLLLEGLELLKANPNWNCYDQDILNYFFADSYRQLPIYYDIFVEAERVVGNYSLEQGIYHYAGMAVNVFQGHDVFDSLYLHYFIKTPWFDENMLLKIFALVPKSHDDCRGYLRKILNDTVGKRRCFLGFADNEAIIRSYFTFAGNERFIAIDQNSGELETNTLVNALKNMSPEEIGVLCVKNSHILINELIANGLTEGVDFVNGAAFFSSSFGGVSLDGRNLIQRL